MPTREGGQTGENQTRENQARENGPTHETGKITLNAQQARQGKELGVMRYVLHISLALAVVAGIVIYAVFAH
ncbi:MAG TPA: hypothetical protein VHC40_14590 [Rhizomicrobium sp.]|jgi:hypothetical protein|nr:hypothetical protein [Rhizomicrobium sp.]